MFSKIFTSRAISASEPNKSQGVFKCDVSSKTKSTANVILVRPSKKPKQTKLKGKDLRRKVRAGTKERVFHAPTAAQLAVMREMRERFLKLPQSDFDYFNAPMPDMRWDDDSDVQPASTDIVPFDVNQFVKPPMDLAPPRKIYVDEIDFEAAGMTWWLINGLDDKTARPVKAVPWFLSE